MTEKSGILLINIGSPSAPETKAVRKYLSQFLHDKNVIELTRWLWCPILHGVILRTRPKRSAAAYAKVWRREDDGSFADEAPLVEITREQARKLSGRLNMPVAIGMRYAQPSIEKGLDELIAHGCTHIGVLPMYPQYAGATTRSGDEAVLKALKNKPKMPQIITLNNYHDDPGYIDVLADSLIAHIDHLDYDPDQVLVSFHGIPKSSVEKGDPYEAQCEGTFNLLKAHQKTNDLNLTLSFQSRFGPKEWLTPYTLTTLLEMPSKGMKNAVVIAPGFPADCLETLEEIAIEAKHEFLEAGGENMSVVPCLNADDAHIETLANLIQSKLLIG